jgi:hypothetical protein
MQLHRCGASGASASRSRSVVCLSFCHSVLASLRPGPLPSVLSPFDPPLSSVIVFLLSLLCLGWVCSARHGSAARRLICPRWSWPVWSRRWSHPLQPPTLVPVPCRRSWRIKRRSPLPLPTSSPPAFRHFGIITSPANLRALCGTICFRSRVCSPRRNLSATASLLTPHTEPSFIEIVKSVSWSIHHLVSRRHHVRRVQTIKYRLRGSPVVRVATTWGDSHG